MKTLFAVGITVITCARNIQAMEPHMNGHQTFTKRPSITRDIIAHSLKNCLC